MSRAAIIVAAGSARRMGFDKLTALLAGKPVLQWSIEAFLACPLVDEVIVVTTADRFELCLPKDAAKPIRRVEGGAERFLSVQAGLDAIRPDCSHVAVHDGARPLIRPEDITVCFESSQEYAAAVLARRMTETIKRANVDGFTEKSIDRENLWIMETPQVFETALLRRAYAALPDSDIVVTDEVSAVEQLGVGTFLVESHHPNPKITFPADLDFAHRLLV